MRIGNGRATSLWHDHWIPEGARISEIITPRIIAHSGLSWHATVAEVIINGQWRFPTSDDQLQAIWDAIPPKDTVENEEDQPVWKHSQTGSFTIASAWEKLRDRKAQNPLHQVIWYAGHIPRQSFILWLASQNRLQTLDRLRKVGITERTHCVLCNQDEETHNHLFFQCNYTKAVWDSISTKGNIRWTNEQWNQLLQ